MSGVSNGAYLASFFLKRLALGAVESLAIAFFLLVPKFSHFGVAYLENADAVLVLSALLSFWPLHAALTLLVACVARYGTIFAHTHESCDWPECLERLKQLKVESRKGNECRQEPTHFCSAPAHSQGKMRVHFFSSPANKRSLVCFVVRREY